MKKTYEKKYIEYINKGLSDSVCKLNGKEVSMENFFRSTTDFLTNKVKNKGKIYLATDVEKYFFEMVDVFNKLKNAYIINKENFRLRPNLIVSTRYERKAIEKKNKAFFLVVKKNLD